MVPMDSFYRIFLYPITFILSLFLANHMTSCLGFCVDIVSNFSINFTLSLNKYIATSTKCLGGTAINVYRNHNGFCIRSAHKQTRINYAKQYVAFLAADGKQTRISYAKQYVAFLTDTDNETPATKQDGSSLREKGSRDCCG